ncbi:hypothetical protein [Pseudomonas oryzihabitans]|uniref:hypothetical protein n=1 Tax=Pseudomonas oryzihabitans TaxID=47885 RepID=UPI00289508E6|nr:hypothetical protein [Pseudomonas oryzihabitans]MDT3721002.1 hypothetical protein [Pseudomonas oryzihabitans]
MSEQTKSRVDAGAPREELPPTLEETQARNAELRIQKMAKQRQQELSERSLIADKNARLVP